MNHMLITIVYTLPGHAPAITTAVVPIQSHLSFEANAKNVYDQYRFKKHYDITITTF